MSGIGQGSACEFDDFGSGSVAREFWGFVQRIRESGLPAHVRHTALEIWLHMRPGKMWSHPSVARLARHTGLSERTIQSDIKKLNDAGLFEVEFSKGGRMQSHNFIARRIAETAQELRGMLDKNPADPAGYTPETPNAVHRFQKTPQDVRGFDGGKPSTTCTVLDETPQITTENPAGRAPEAVRVKGEVETLPLDSGEDDRTDSIVHSLPNGPHSSVWLDESGQPQVANGKRQALEQILAGKAGVDEALKAVAEKIDAQGDLWPSIVTQVGIYAASIKPKRKTKAPVTYSTGFEAFWTLYPRKEGKGKAHESWEAYSIEERRRIYAALKKQEPVLRENASRPGGNFCPMPATWLNQRRFDDDLTSVKKSSAAAKFDAIYEGVL